MWTQEEPADLLPDPPPSPAVEELWTRHLRPGDAPDVGAAGLRLAVRRGDLIGFAVGRALGDRASAARWETSVEYDDGDGYASTDSSDLAQGPIWYYFVYDPYSGALVAMEDVVDGPGGKVRMPGEASGYRASPTEPSANASVLRTSNCTAVRAWKAPKDGRVTVRGVGTVTGNEGEAVLSVLRIAEVLPRRESAGARLGFHRWRGPTCDLRRQAGPAGGSEAQPRPVGGSSSRPGVSGTSIFRQWTELRNLGAEPLALQAKEGLFPRASAGAIWVRSPATGWMRLTS